MDETSKKNLDALLGKAKKSMDWKEKAKKEIEMKTPMQELITAIRLVKYSEINEQAWEAYDYVIDIAERMLEKEKEVIMDAYIAGESDATHKIDSALNHYNETFNSDTAPTEAPSQSVK